MPRFSDPALRKGAGVEYTPQPLARFVANRVALASATKPGQSLTILDPAVGDGGLIAALVVALRSRGVGVDRVVGLDIDAAALDAARSRLRGLCGDLELIETDFLDWTEGRDPCFDAIIANPPYVRTQVLGSERARRLASAYGMRGRIDLYQVFAAVLPGLLCSGGTIGMITSNRFMSTRSGRDLRRRLFQELQLDELWDLGDTRLFEAAVLPAVVVGRRRREPDNRSVPFVSVYSTERPGGRRVSSLWASLETEGVIELEEGGRFEIVRGALEVGDDPERVWAPRTGETGEWLDHVRSRTWRTFADVGTVRVGIKTTADRVFISEHWPGPGAPDRPELLRPIITHHVARRFRGHAPAREVLYTHRTRAGRREVVPLSEVPIARAHLESHRERLASRAYVAEAGRAWYEVWVPQDPDAWGPAKLVFRDIVDRPTFWLDETGAVVNGDCYWMRLDADVDPAVLYLALAVANSSFIEAFYDRAFHNKLYAGRRRFMTQYVEAFPLPDPTGDEALELIEGTRALCAALDRGETTAHAEAKLDARVWAAFGVAPPASAGP